MIIQCVRWIIARSRWLLYQNTVTSSFFTLLLVQCTDNSIFDETIRIILVLFVSLSAYEKVMNCYKTWFCIDCVLDSLIKIMIEYLNFIYDVARFTNEHSQRVQKFESRFFISVDARHHFFESSLASRIW